MHLLELRKPAMASSEEMRIQKDEGAEFFILLTLTVNGKVEVEETEAAQTGSS